MRALQYIILSVELSTFPNAYSIDTFRVLRLVRSC